MANLSSAQIDQAIGVLRGKDGEYVSSGQGAEGFGSRGGQLYRVSLEGGDRQEYPVNEADLRTALGSIDLDLYSQRYAIGALKEMGLNIPLPPLP